MAHGAIEWMDIPSPDPGAQARFYERVFGWKVQIRPEWPDYPMFTAGESVGGGFAKMGKPNASGGILVYVSVDDIDAALVKVNQNGGSTVQTKQQIAPEVGWWGSFHDPAGNLMGLYETARKP